MVKETIIPAGYKKTEVGVIPNNWEVIDVGKITEFHKQGYYTKESYKDNGKYFLLRGTDMQNPRIDLTTTPRIDANDIDYSNYKVQKGDVLIVRSGAIGRYGIVEKIPDSIFGSYLINFRLNQRKILNVFFGYFYESEHAIKQLKTITQGSSNININAENIKALKIPFPPTKEEQIAITSPLGDVDALITSLEKLITKKRNIKQAAMQQLLTGKKRLPGFSGEWEKARLGDESELITKGTTPTSLGREFKDNGINFIKIESLEENGNIIIEKIAFIDEETHKLLRRSQLKEKDILISIAGALGRIAIVKIEILQANTNQALALVRLKQQTKLDLSYLFYFLNSSQIKSHINAINVQAAQANLSLENINDFEIRFPQLPEQTAIAQILSDMDSELKAMEQKRDKYIALKQGMMQELLTGKTRLV